MQKQYQFYVDIQFLSKRQDVSSV